MKTTSWIGLILCVSILFSCEKFLPPEPAPNQILAAPIDGLSPEQMALHIRGDEEFAHVFSPEEGLGPIFVQSSCESCHAGDGKGNPFNNLVRFGAYNDAGIWDGLTELGGPQVQHRSIAHFTPEALPKGVASSEFVAPNVTGLGYLEAVPSETLTIMADANDEDQDGISGTLNQIELPAWALNHPFFKKDEFKDSYGRFGRKAGAINLYHQVVNAYVQDMGITSEFEPLDPVNKAMTELATDDVPDPEISRSTVEQVVFYLQTLEKPLRRNEDSEDVKTGELIFNEIGCESCHKNTLKTGPSNIAALNEVEFHPYTDMLIHDMGAALDDGYTEGSAETYEWRTTPLWGLGLQHESQGGQMYLMHDGRAATYQEAIDLHGGEAANSTLGFGQLSDEEKSNLIKFLDSL